MFSWTDMAQWLLWRFKTCILQKICRWHICPMSLTWLSWKAYKLFKFETNKKKLSLPMKKNVKIVCLFLDILISRSENSFKTSVYHKPTFSEVYSNFSSFTCDQYKIGLIFTFLFRTFSVVSDVSRFHTEVSHLKEILRKNAFPIKLVDNCITVEKRRIVYCATISW